MVRVMVFIDDDWLTRAASALSLCSDERDIDRRRLAKVLGEEASFFLRSDRSDVVRTFVFGTRSATPDQDASAAGARLFHGETTRGRTRGETCAAFASTLCGYAALPYAYDVALVVTGDADLFPVLRQARRLGKRVVLASIEEHCDRAYIDQPHEPVRDADIIWLSDVVPQMAARSERYLAECHSPLHQGPRKVWTDYPPRKGRPFYCDDCRRRFAEQRFATGEEGPSPRRENDASEPPPEHLGDPFFGEICKVVREKGYGFVKGDDGREFFFHVSDLSDLPWEEVDTGIKVSFLVKREPDMGRAGAAGRISRVERGEPEPSASEEKEEKREEGERSFPSVG